MYEVIDSHTGDVIGSYSTFKRARNKADKLDLVYGAIRYRVEYRFAPYCLRCES